MRLYFDGTPIPEGALVKAKDGVYYPLEQSDIDAAQARDTERYADHITAYRRKRELGGTSISLGGQTLEIQTDDEIQRKILAARVMAKEDADYTVNWKLPSGFVRLNATALIAISDAIRNHIQKCFDAEAAIKDQTFDSIEAVEAAFDAAYKDA